MASTYKIDEGVRELLLLGVASIPDRLSAIKAELEAGELTEGTRALFVALGWLTKYDGRLKLVRPAGGGTTPVRARRTRGNVDINQQRALPDVDTAVAAAAATGT